MPIHHIFRRQSNEAPAIKCDICEERPRTSPLYLNDKHDTICHTCFDFLKQANHWHSYRKSKKAGQLLDLIAQKTLPCKYGHPCSFESKEPYLSIHEDNCKFMQFRCPSSWMCYSTMTGLENFQKHLNMCKYVTTVCTNSSDLQYEGTITKLEPAGYNNQKTEFHKPTVVINKNTQPAAAYLDVTETNDNEWCFTLKYIGNQNIRKSLNATITLSKSRNFEDQRNPTITQQSQPAHYRDLQEPYPMNDITIKMSRTQLSQFRTNSSMINYKFKITKEP